MPIPLPIRDALESVDVATPRAVPWGERRGDDRSRCCQAVFDQPAMTAEAPTPLTDPTGRLARLWRRAAWAASLFALLLLPACRAATQGRPPDAEAVGKTPTAASIGEVPSVVPADSDTRTVDLKLQPGNALAALANNKFDAWTISHRVIFPLDRDQVEVAPMPRLLEK